ncbi:MAG: efflux transporter outer membrane subunit [Phycisphaerae bacterium]|nr:efflux transporter outer membrane subunit [Phycisphaerae bacterium]
MRRTSAVVWIIAAALVLGTSGCMLGPDYVRPETPAYGTQAYFNSPAGWVDPNNPEAIGRWWQGFDDEVINSLVDKALLGNYDLKAAAARVAESEAILGQVRGARLPEVFYAGDRTRSKNTIFFLGEPFTTYTTVYSQGFSINYIADLFGRLRRNEQAAFAELLASANSQQALVHGIVAQVVRTRVTAATQQELLDIANANIRSREQTVEIVERRYNQGLVPALDVYLARENLAAIRSEEPVIRRALAQARHSLNVLIGQIPGAPTLLPDTLPDTPSLGPVPVGVPAALLDRRPDVRAAENQLTAATQRVGASIAALFPDLTLSASWGTTSDTFRGLGFLDGEVYSAIIALAAPVFQGGRLRAGVDAAWARTEQAAANYAQVVLGAMREVEDALVDQQTTAERVKILEVRLVEAARAEALALERYQRGLEQILIVLDTERRRIQAESALAIAKGNLYEARINLYLALGGDWRIEAEAAAIVNGEDEKI